MPSAGRTILKQDLDPSNHGAPGDRKDGGGRSGPSLAYQLIALTPLSGQAQTLATHPTFWAHVPADRGWVMLQLQDATTAAQIAPVVAFPVGDGPGIMGFQWPESMPALEEDRLYRWTLIYCCSDTLLKPQLSVTGTVVRRSDAGLETTGLHQDPIAWSMAQGFWLEAVAIAALQRWDNPQRTQTDWHTVLTHPEIALEELLEARVSRCCSVDGR
jgi:hypothetical protein